MTAAGYTNPQPSLKNLGCFVVIQPTHQKHCDSILLFLGSAVNSFQYSLLFPDIKKA